MSYPFMNVARAVALRAMQVEGGDYAAREAAYLAASIEGSLDGIEVPYSALKHNILATARELAMLVANSSNQLFRRKIGCVTAIINDGASIPTIDNAGAQLIGSLDGFVDSSVTPNRSLTEGTLHEIDRYVRDAASAERFFKINPYQFKLQDQVLRHTCAAGAVYGVGCSWDQATQSTNYDAEPTTAAPFTVVAADVSSGSDTITEAAHGLYTGARVRAVIGTGLAALPAPLATNTVYYAIVIDANTIKLAASLISAITATALNLTNVGTDGTTPNSLVPIDPIGGGLCPLPQELEVLHWCKTLAVLPAEGWFIPEANFYRSLVAEKQNEIIEGKIRLMGSPQIPMKTASIDAAKD